MPECDTEILVPMSKTRMQKPTAEVCLLCLLFRLIGLIAEYIHTECTYELEMHLHQGQ